MRMARKTVIIDDAETLLKEVDAFLEKWEMSPTAFGQESINNGHFYRRLAAGKEIFTSTATRVRQFMADYEAARQKGEQQ